MVHRTGCAPADRITRLGWCFLSAAHRLQLTVALPFTVLLTRTHAAPHPPGEQDGLWSPTTIKIELLRPEENSSPIELTPAVKPKKGFFR